MRGRNPRHSAHTEYCMNDRVDTSIVFLGKTAQTSQQRESDPSQRSQRAQQAEPAARQSRDSAASPPAVAGSFSRKQGIAVLAICLAFGVAGCTNSAPTAEELALTQQQESLQEDLLIDPTYTVDGVDPSAISDPAEKSAKPTAEPKDAAEQPEPSSVPSVEPSFEPSESPEHTAIAYEPGTDGIERVQRPGQSVSPDDIVQAEVSAKGSGAEYADRVAVSIAAEADGTVTSEGPGYFTGACYVVYKVTVANHSDHPVDLSNVVITAANAETDEILLPLYGEVEAYDFTGVVSAKQSRSTNYAFIIPDGISRVSFTIDIDAEHAPVTLSSKVAKK